MIDDYPTNTLIDLAVEVVSPKMIGGNLVGDVGCALATDRGNVYRGVCLDAPSGLGFCAERTAVSQMITNREYKVNKIVAVWRESATGKIYILPPCGACRQYLHSICEDGLETKIVIARDKATTLRELLPRSAWPRGPA